MVSKTTRRTTVPAPLSSSAPAAPAAPEPGPRTPARAKRLLVLAIVLTAVNLRPAITSLGALLEDVRAGLGMSGGVAGLLTSLPPLCFAVFGIAAPRLAGRFGATRVVGAGLIALTTGLLLRPYAGGVPGFLAASALALMGIAVGNVLMPVIVKRHFPDRVGPMTGLYSMGLALGTAAAAAATVPLTDAMGEGWRVGLAVWAGLAGVAVVPWVLFGRGTRAGTDAGKGEPAAANRGGAGESTQGLVRGAGVRRGDTRARARGAVQPAAPSGAPASGSAPLRITRSRTAWALAVFFGLQATGAYVTMGWMPQIFRDAGVSAGTAGLLLAVTMVLGVPLAFVIPRLAARLPHQGPIVVALGACGLAGYTGLYVAPAAGAWAWALLLGVANCAFPLALTMVGMRARTGAGVAQLSGFAQGVGYLISIPGPLLIGVLYQATGDWDVPLTLMALLLVPQTAVGVLAGRRRTVEEELTA
ncbi:MFS transporter [Streptomyces sp. V2]|uniref:CynX/NimT family MFS transporter n=1 Tax=Streptomyces TaxID=1883 RepID=UPI000D66C26F|nr:MFS transporter [Streptomyces sp. V2]PWG11192.1 MFS transporter [Streptomyces sp. V2]